MKQEIDKRNGVWVTPKKLFEPLCREFDLKIDAAASPDNAMLPFFFVVESETPSRRIGMAKEFGATRHMAVPKYTNG